MPLLVGLEHDISNGLSRSATSSPKNDMVQLTYEAERRLINTKLSDATAEAEGELANLAKRVETEVGSTVHDVARLVDDFIAALQAESLDDSQRDRIRVTWDALVSHEIQPRIDQLDSLALEIRSAALTGVPSNSEITEALEEELLALRDAQLTRSSNFSSSV